jgi:hypothetical protein
MKSTDLKNARRYELSRDVANPSLDKRKSYEPSALAWTKGDRFRALIRSEKPFDDEREYVRMELEAVYMSATDRNPVGRIGSHHDGFEALVAALVELPESVSDQVAMAGFSPRNVHHTVWCGMFKTLIDERSRPLPPDR